MQIPVTAADFEIKRVWLKRSSHHAESGYCDISDLPQGPYNRHDVTVKAARLFHKSVKYVEFPTPISVTVVLWNDRVIAMECATNTTETDTERHYARAIQNLNDGQWYFDGVLLYRFAQPTMDAVVAAAQVQPTNTSFRTTEVTSIDMSTLQKAYKIGIRYCLIYIAGNGQYVVSPPVWNSLEKSSIRDLQNEIMGLGDIQGFDVYHGVNIMFTLNTAKMVSKLFGYRSIEPLKLPAMMLRYKTVNLMALNPALQKTTYVDMPPSQMFAWIMGLLLKTTTYQQLVMIRRVLQYLTLTGIIAKDNVQLGSVLKNPDAGLEAIPVTPLNLIPLKRTVDGE